MRVLKSEPTTELPPWKRGGNVIGEPETGVIDCASVDTGGDATGGFKEGGGFGLRSRWEVRAITSRILRRYRAVASGGTGRGLEPCPLPAEDEPAEPDAEDGTSVGSGELVEGG